MFFLSASEHTLRLPPHLLNLPLHEAIKGELDSLFLDKVIDKLGLCVSVYDIKSINGGFIYPSNGASTYTVKFRLVMFRPFVGEVISAKLLDSTKAGIRLTLGFFEDIYVPSHFLPKTNHYEPAPGDKDKVIWFWEYGENNYPIAGDGEIRFQVVSVSYPPLPLNQDSAAPENESDPKNVKPFAPMVVTGTLDLDGLGLVSWW